MKKGIIYSFFLLLIASSFLTGCTNNKKQSADGKITVYTTVYPLQYFTERMAGEYVNVKSIYPPGADEHTFEPSQKDMMNIADADIFFYIGLGLEGFVQKANQTLKNEGVTFVPVAENLKLPKATIEKEEDHDEQEHHGDIDPHVWLDPVYANEIALVIKDSLINQLPDHKKTIEENYQQISKELVNLDSKFKNTIENAPHKEIIVSHAAYGYWEKRYGLKQISISGLSSTAEPTQKELENIVKLAEEKNLKYVLFEQNIHSKLGEIIEHEIGAKPLPIHNLATLTEDNIKNNETYFTIMEKNIDSISKALNE